MDGYKSQLHYNSNFDYNILKVIRRCTEEHRQALRQLESEYRECIKEYKSKKNRNKEETNENRNFLCKHFKEEAEKICPNPDERMNIILDITYGYKGNRQFCWDCIGDLIIKRLEKLEEINVYT